MPAGLINHKAALPKFVVFSVPKILDTFPPVTRLRIFVVGNPVLLEKFAVSPVPTLKLPKLWNRLPPLLGRVPPVIVVVVPLVETLVPNPEDVILVVTV